MAQGPQSSRIIVLEGGDAPALITTPGGPGDTDPGLQPAGSGGATLLDVAPAGRAAVEPHVEPDVEPDVLLASLALRGLPEVTATSGERAAVFASADATPARRHDTPVPEPAVIAPDPRREPTRRIPREWVEPLDAIAKRAMGRSGRGHLRWAVVGVVGAAIIIAVVVMTQRLSPGSVNKTDYAVGVQAPSPPALPAQAPPTPAAREPIAEETSVVSPPAPRARPARSHSPSNQEDPDYRLLK
jgi:hypothetical protein